MAVSWLERGDPNGEPVLHFHGWPSSRLEQFADDELLRKYKLRWISLDRPGYGGTRFHPEHSFTAWARIINDWADSNGLAEFHVSGFSGGGPFAQAVAAQLNHRVLSLTLIASLAPFGPRMVSVPAPWAGPASWILDYAPFIATGGLRLFKRLRKRFPEAAERFQMSRFHPIDQAILNQPDARDRISRSFDESTIQGVDHLVADLQLYRGNWDLDYDAILCPTQVWVGDIDTQVPPACSRWLAGRIAGAALHEFSGEAHYLAIAHAEEILQAIKESSREQ